jgi:hypothetical protein
MWCTEEQVRRKLGLRSEEVPDGDILHYIEDAQKDMRGDISYEMSNDELDGAINGSNTTFTTTFCNIADRNFDLIIGTLDVTVYGWTDKNDPATKSTLTVGTIYPEYGKIVLDTAPSNSYVKITADYFYNTLVTDMTLYPDACAYLSAFYYGLSETLLMPKQWMHGAYRFLKSEDIPLLEAEYQKRLLRIRKVSHECGDTDDVKFERQGVGYQY